MKIYLRQPENFHPETLKFYQENFEIVDEKDAVAVVINTFEPIEIDKPVACNSTGIDHIKSPLVISLRGSDLSDLTAVPELCLGMAIFLTRLYKKEEIRGKTLGLIGGMGRIGKKFGDMAEVMGMKVIVYDNLNDGEYENSEAHLKEILQESDIVSLHITADEHNRGFMNQHRFQYMKKGSIFLNSARAWLVDDMALVLALDSNLAAAWFDFEVGVNRDNLFTTPHLGGSTKESKQKSEMIIAKKLLENHGRP